MPDLTRPPRVLIADPDPVLREAIGRVLAREGYQVLGHAGDGPEAKKLARKLSPCIVVLGRTETERRALDEASALRCGGGTAVLLLSPVPNLAWVRAVRAAGVDALLARPPREADLVAAVEMALGRRAEARELAQEVRSLKDRVEAGAVIQQAKEVLVRRDGITDAEAYQRLRRQAERTGSSLRSVAEAVLLAARVAAPAA